MSDEDAFDRIQQLEDMLYILEEKTEDDFARQSKEYEKLWDAIYHIEVSVQKLMEKLYED